MNEHEYEMKRYKIDDLFEIIKPSKQFQIKTSTEGCYPLISSSSVNNGVCKYINEYTNENQFTISRNGSVGYCFHHNYKFSTTQDVFVLNSKFDDLNPDLLCVYITIVLSNKYNYMNKLTTNKLLNEYIYYPCKIKFSPN